MENTPTSGRQHKQSSATKHFSGFSVLFVVEDFFSPQRTQRAQRRRRFSGFSVLFVVEDFFTTENTKSAKKKAFLCALCVLCG
jgi:hypothetical protein